MTTTPPDLKSIAEELADKIDNHVMQHTFRTTEEFFSLIVTIISKALTQYGDARYTKGFGMGLAGLDSHTASAYERGAEDMRERAAKLADDVEYAASTNIRLVKAIKALPLTSEETP